MGTGIDFLLVRDLPWIALSEGIRYYFLVILKFSFSQVLSAMLATLLLWLLKTFKSLICFFLSVLSYAY